MSCQMMCSKQDKELKGHWWKKWNTFQNLVQVEVEVEEWEGGNKIGEADTGEKDPPLMASPHDYVIFLVG